MSHTSYFLFVLKAHCFRYEPAISCDLSAFWRHGFVALQAAINSAIIEVSANV